MQGGNLHDLQGHGVAGGVAAPREQLQKGLQVGAVGGGGRQELPLHEDVGDELAGVEDARDKEGLALPALDVHLDDEGGGRDAGEQVGEQDGWGFPD